MSRSDGCVLAVIASAVLAPSLPRRKAGKDSGHLESEAGRIYYEVAGSGPAVVLLHDGIAHREVFNGQFARLAEDYRVMRFDHRGYGLSDPATAPYMEH